MAPTRINGVKRTLPSRFPDAVVCDLQVLRDAPYTMTAAGVGDLLAAFVSLPDWWLANRLGMDSTYSQLPGRPMGSLEHGLMADSPEIATRSMEGMRSLAKWIALAGLSMSLAHATSPMSGFEHVVSHLLDLQAEQRGEPLAMHGSQVGLASILGLAAYRSLTGDFDPRGLPLASVFPEEALARAQVLQAFGQVDPSGRAGEECWSDYRIKLEAWHAQREREAEVLGDWQAVRSELDAQLRPAARLREILRAVAAPLTFAALRPPARSEAVRFAFEKAPFMRRRLMVADLLLFFHLDRVRIWEKAWGEVGAKTVLGQSCRASEQARKAAHSHPRGLTRRLASASRTCDAGCALVRAARFPHGQGLPTSRGTVVGMPIIG